MTYKKQHAGGFTVVELLIALAVFSVIVLLVATFSADIFKTTGTIQSSLQAQQDARNVLRQLAAELRTASISSTGAYPIAEASNNRLRFYSDIDNDGLKEEVVYYLSGDGKNLLKDVRKPTGAPLSYTAAFKTSILIRDVMSSAGNIFAYYDTNYDGTTPPLAQPVTIANIRLIKASITIERDPNRSPVPIVVTTQVSLRNLKDNL